MQQLSSFHKWTWGALDKWSEIGTNCFGCSVMLRETINVRRNCDYRTRRNLLEAGSRKFCNSFNIVRCECGVKFDVDAPWKFSEIFVFRCVCGSTMTHATNFPASWSVTVRRWYDEFWFGVDESEPMSHRCGKSSVLSGVKFPWRPSILLVQRTCEIRCVRCVAVYKFSMMSHSVYVCSEYVSMWCGFLSLQSFWGAIWLAKFYVTRVLVSI